MEGWCWPQKHWTNKDKRWLRNFSRSWRSRLSFWGGMLVFLAIVAFIVLAAVFGWVFWILLGIFAVLGVVGIVDTSKKQDAFDETLKQARDEASAIRELHKARYAEYMKKFNSSKS